MTGLNSALEIVNKLFCDLEWTMERAKSLFGKVSVHVCHALHQGLYEIYGKVGESENMLLPAR